MLYQFTWDAEAFCHAGSFNTLIRLGCSLSPSKLKLSLDLSNGVERWRDLQEVKVMGGTTLMKRLV
jgi:hypothetical protein